MSPGSSSTMFSSLVSVVVSLDFIPSQPPPEGGTLAIHEPAAYVFHFNVNWHLSLPLAHQDTGYLSFSTGVSFLSVCINNLDGITDDKLNVFTRMCGCSV